MGFDAFSARIQATVSTVAGVGAGVGAGDSMWAAKCRPSASISARLVSPQGCLEVWADGRGSKLLLLR